MHIALEQLSRVRLSPKLGWASDGPMELSLEHFAGSEAGKGYQEAGVVAFKIDTTRVDKKASGHDEKN